MRRFSQWTGCMTLMFATGFAWVISISALAQAQDLESTEPPIVEMSRPAVIAKLSKILNLKDPVEAERSLAAVWDLMPSTLDAVVQSLSSALPEVRQCLEQSAKSSNALWAPPPYLRNEKTDPFIKSNLSLYFARDLVRKNQLDEALSALEGVDAGQIVDLAAYYFSLAACQLHLHQRSETLASLSKLERVTPLPERYRVLGILMKQIVDPLKKDELGGIAHDMREIRRRLDLGRADAKTVEIEKDVIARLDKLIKKLEEQRQQQQQQANNSNESNRPADESQPLGAKGEGKVTEKTFKKKDAWGNLPPKERDKAMQELGREFPAHYRDAIEEYFRTLAKQKDGNRP